MYRRRLSHTARLYQAVSPTMVRVPVSAHPFHPLYLQSPLATTSPPLFTLACATLCAMDGLTYETEVVRIRGLHGRKPGK
jgi:hypothetical protein